MEELSLNILQCSAPSLIKGNVNAVTTTQLWNSAISFQTSQLNRTSRYIIRLHAGHVCACSMNIKSCILFIACPNCQNNLLINGEIVKLPDNLLIVVHRNLVGSTRKDTTAVRLDE